ncbi:glycosyltransferase family 2 protein [Candidatus Pseudothioglobus singularis]|jgi:glycosyltransferase involved in cell wall biosynthesis|uniref:Glycosyltransferase 2-like domain-containing protein n=1 Tax=Candidatus Pseudothioglobus singularis PS1 TaxID=1125411 RepID=A0A0M4LH50_9GAMM|nr:glycosyltransferase family 2 protein [Candidatus Pseudothioglobus singularis]ALE02768.1 hypothetical protein W908_07005 [Candidatus Pseudothioglobus singularis PS1]
MKSEFLTVIIPFYNAIRYKEIILNNLSRNKSNQVSFILIDDGSEDDLLDLIKKEVEENNIVFIKNPKKFGVSKSRNIGIRNCRSDFLMFCDVDDDLDLSQINNLSDTLEQENDLIIFKHQSKDKYNFQQKSFNHNQNGQLDKKRRLSLIIDYLKSPVGSSILIHCWASIYKRKFLIENSLLFNESIEKFEDSLFISEVITNANTIKISDIEIYSHWVHQGGLSYFSENGIGKFSLHVEVYYQFLKNHGIFNAIDLKHSATNFYVSKLMVQIQNRSFGFVKSAIEKILLEDSVIESLKFYNIECKKMPLIKNWMFKSKLIITLMIMFYRFIN